MIRDPSHGMFGRSHSCHAERAAVGRPGGIPRVVGVRDASRPLVAVEGDDGDVAARRRARARTRRGRPRARRSAPRRGRRGRARAPHRRSAANDEEATVGGGVDQRVVVDPAVPAAAVRPERGHRELGGEGDRRGGPSAGADHEVDPAAERVEPGQPGARRATSAPRPGCASGATAAAEMPSRPEANERATAAAGSPSPSAVTRG